MRIVKDLFALKWCKMRGFTEVRNLKELGVLGGGGFIRDNTRKHTTDLDVCQ